MGLKLVRGAYIQEERKEEIKFGLKIVWSNKYETDTNYDNLSQMVCDNI